MPVYCDVCESVIGRDEERTLINGRDYCLDCNLLSHSINTREDIGILVRFLHRQGWAYHWHDNPRDIGVWMHDCGREAFPPSDEQIDMIEARIDEAIWLDEDHLWDVTINAHGEE